MKTCNVCKTPKELDSFGKNKNKPDGLNSTCKTCRNDRQKVLFAQDPERYRGYKRKWEANNKPKIAATKHIYHKRIRPKARIRLQEWRAENPELVKQYNRNSKASTKLSSSKYKAQAIQATPKWLTESQKEEMKAVYKSADVMSVFHEEEFQVDHQEPLRGEFSSGLCVPWNLQILLRKDNRFKSNKLIQPVIIDNKLCHVFDWSQQN